MKPFVFRIALSLTVCAGLVSCSEQGTPAADQAGSAVHRRGDVDSQADTDKTHAADSSPTSVIAPEEGAGVPESGWSEQLRPIAAAMPSGKRTGEPAPGAWREYAFVEHSSDGLPAVRARYRSGESRFIKRVDEDTQEVHTGNMNLIQEADFSVVVAGDSARTQQDEIGARLLRDGWERETTGLIVPGAEFPPVAVYRKERETVYLSTIGSLLLHALERDEAPKTRGAGTSFGAQQIVQFQARWSQNGPQSRKANGS